MKYITYFVHQEHFWKSFLESNFRSMSKDDFLAFSIEICKCKYSFPRTNVHWWIAHIKSTNVNYESKDI